MTSKAYLIVEVISACGQATQTQIATRELTLKNGSQALCSQREAALTINDNLSGKIFGSSRYYFEDTPVDAVSIGFTFLAFNYWGGKTNLELKSLMLAHAFQAFNAVWFHISPLNIRSQKATQKLGAEFVNEQSLSLSGKLEVWKCYQLNKESWPRPV